MAKIPTEHRILFFLLSSEKTMEPLSKITQDKGNTSAGIRSAIQVLDQYSNITGGATLKKKVKEENPETYDYLLEMHGITNKKLSREDLRVKINELFTEILKNIKFLRENLGARKKRHLKYTLEIGFERVLAHEGEQTTQLKKDIKEFIKYVDNEIVENYFREVRKTLLKSDRIKFIKLVKSVEVKPTVDNFHKETINFSHVLVTLSEGDAKPYFSEIFTAKEVEDSAKLRMSLKNRPNSPLEGREKLKLTIDMPLLYNLFVGSDKFLAIVADEDDVNYVAGELDYIDLRKYFITILKGGNNKAAIKAIIPTINGSDISDSLFNGNKFSPYLHALLVNPDVSKNVFEQTMTMLKNEILLPRDKYITAITRNEPSQRESIDSGLTTETGSAADEMYASAVDDSAMYPEYKITFFKDNGLISEDDNIRMMNINDELIYALPPALASEIEEKIQGSRRLLTKLRVIWQNLPEEERMKHGEYNIITPEGVELDTLLEKAIYQFIIKNKRHFESVITAEPKGFITKSRLNINHAITTYYAVVNRYTSKDLKTIKSDIAKNLDSDEKLIELTIDMADMMEEGLLEFKKEFLLQLQDKLEKVAGTPTNYPALFAPGAKQILSRLNRVGLLVKEDEHN